MPAKDASVQKTPGMVKGRAPSLATSSPKHAKTPDQMEHNKWSKLQDVVMVVADSNGKLLDPTLLHDSKKVIIEKRDSWETALNNIPKTSNPEVVKDIVFMTGMKDVTEMSQQLPDILDLADTTAKSYQRAFHKATIHLGSIAPANERCINYNSHLQGLAKTRDTPFISTEGLFSERSGMVKEGTLSGGLFTKTGIRIFAKQMKRSLYQRKFNGKVNPQAGHVQQWPQPSGQLRQPLQKPQPQRQQWPQPSGQFQQPFQPQPQRPSTLPQCQQNLDNVGGVNMIQALETFFKIAKACLPQ